MAYKRATAGFVTQGLRFEALSSHAALVASFRDTLAARKSPLDSIPAKQLEQARKEFRQLPEVAGEPLSSSDHPDTDHLVETLRDTVVALVRRHGPDLSTLQLGVFLTCYLQRRAHTVGSLAADLNVSKPTITRALNRLGELDLTRRKPNPMDRRNGLIQPTLKGAFFLRDLRSLQAKARSKPAKAEAGEMAPAKRRRG